VTLLFTTLHVGYRLLIKVEMGLWLGLELFGIRVVVGVGVQVDNRFSIKVGVRIRVKGGGCGYG